MGNRSSIIGIAGAAGSGKDTVADHLVLDCGYTKASFALPIKEALTAMLGIDFVNMPREWKETPLYPFDVTPRRMMQTLGTEWGRDLIDQNMWVKALDLYIEQSTSNRFVIPDVRFQNEVDWIKASDGLLFYLHRPGTEPVEGHPSESGVSPAGADVLIVNNGTIDDMIENVMRAVRSYECRE